MNDTVTVPSGEQTPKPLERQPSVDKVAAPPSTLAPEARQPEKTAASLPPPPTPTRFHLSASQRRTMLLVGGPVIVVLVALYVYLTGGRYVSTDNAYVKADKLSVSTDVSGIVKEILVHDNEAVKMGQVLFRLDDEPYRIALAGAEAQLGAVRNEIETLKATYNQKLSEIEQAKRDSDYYKANYQRQQDLASRGVSSQAAFDQATRDIDVSNEKVRTAQRQAEVTLAQLGGRASDPVESNPRYLQVKAQVDKARRDFDHTVVTAPMNGIATNVSALQVGQFLSAAQGAFSLVSSDNVWIDANPKETDLNYLQSGNPATVTVDAYPGVTWRASVASLSPGTGSEFSILPAQNASGNWVKVVQRVPVRLKVEVPSDAPQLRSGMSVYVSIDTGHRRGLGDLFRDIGHAIGL